MWSRDIIENEIKYLYSRINHAIDEACPLVNTKHVLRLSWWSDDLSSLRREVRRAWHWQCCNPSEYNFSEFKRIQRNYKQIIRRAKRSSWKKFCSDMKDGKGISFLNKIIQDKTNSKTVVMLVKPDGEFTSNPEEMLQALFDVHFPGSLMTPVPSDEPLVWHDQEIFVEPLSWITGDRFIKAVKQFKDCKAAGMDLIKPIVIKHFPNYLINRMCNLYTACITLGYSPEAWRKSKTIFIPKLGREDYSDPRSFRPISLMPFLFKALERLVLWQMEDTSLRQFPIHKNQHAFRKGHSAEIAISKLVSKIEKAIYKKEYSVVVFLDIEGAYDNVSIRAQVAGMIKHGVLANIINWYEQYLKKQNYWWTGW